MIRCVSDSNLRFLVLKTNSVYRPKPCLQFSNRNRVHLLSLSIDSFVFSCGFRLWQGKGSVYHMTLWVGETDSIVPRTAWFCFVSSLINMEMDLPVLKLETFIGVTWIPSSGNCFQDSQKKSIKELRLTDHHIQTVRCWPPPSWWLLSCPFLVLAFLCVIKFLPCYINL